MGPVVLPDPSSVREKALAAIGQFPKTDQHVNHQKGLAGKLMQLDDFSGGVDAALSTAGLQVLRVPASGFYSQAALKTQVLKLLKQPPTAGQRLSI